MNELPILPTTVIGSYPRPKWLREMIRLNLAGRVTDDELAEAFNDSVISVFRDHQLAGVDVPSDGEMRRDEMTEFFAKKLKGFKFYGPVRVWGTNYYNKPSVVGKIQYEQPMLVNEFEFAKGASYTPNLKITITGPYTIADWSYNEYYRTKYDMAKDLAKTINLEIKKLIEVGAKIIQVDEPALHSHSEEVEWAIDITNEAIAGTNVKTIIHICYGDYSLLTPYIENLKYNQINLALKNYNYKPLKLFKKWHGELGIGVIDVHQRRVESAEEVAEDIEHVLTQYPAKKIWINPDCGLKLLPRSIAFQKLKSMVDGTKIVREKLKS
ncbi:methionine synthase [Sulfolobales archaeon HS-7]|nr:methionine synthase [Sulfolobales archaeon HS-7]